MRALGIPSSELSLALAACHDTFEEGTGIRVELDEVGVRRVDLHELISRFPEGDLGASLAVGIAALTESRYVEIVLALPEEAILGFEECARRYRGDLSGFAGRAPVLTKIHLQDPLVFGGLALQIRETVASLVSAARGTAGSAALDLARAIVEVELGDRVSDIATLERQLEYYSDDLRFARYRTIAYASRMLNMHEKLREAAAFLPGCQLDPALAGYLTILETKLDEIGERLSDAGASRIGARSVADFHARAFLPIQAKADEIMTGFVRSKVGELVRPLIEPRGRPPGRVDKLPDTI